MSTCGLITPEVSADRKRRGIAIGYLVRGEPAPSGLETVEREVPVIAVTVPEGG